MKGWFVAGTDTGIGKTRVACALVHRLRAQGYRTVAMKPVASGCLRSAHGLRNEDALALIEASATAAPYGDVNPYAFEPAIAPHIAAAEAHVTVELEVVRAAYSRLTRDADAVVVEGLGGWRVPLAPELEAGDLAAAFGLPVVLVVGMRLGCLNHALLTASAIASGGCRLAGWVANCIEPAMPRLHENIATLCERLPAPLLGTLPFEPAPAALAASAARLRLPD
ncbi:dethiobiotin synthase [Ectothiorhodospiraceae bacterium 2226]|nr:dethiobiotin synthase [Ectothiorhodospiraceae bacterium 2226]